MILYADCKIDKDAKKKIRLTDRAIFKHVRRLSKEHNMSKSSKAQVSLVDNRIEIKLCLGTIHTGFDMLYGETSTNLPRTQKL